MYNSISALVISLLLIYVYCIHRRCLFCGWLSMFVCIQFVFCKRHLCNIESIIWQNLRLYNWNHQMSKRITLKIPRSRFFNGNRNRTACIQLTFDGRFCANKKSWSICKGTVRLWIVMKTLQHTCKAAMISFKCWSDSLTSLLDLWTATLRIIAMIINWAQ